MPLVIETSKKCTRCSRKNPAFVEGIKTCNACRIQKAEYQRTPAGRKVHNLAKAKWRKTANGKRLHYAHAHVSAALKRGDLIKLPCEKCGSKDVQAHHDNHDNRLDVRWLCLLHHKEAHYVTMG